MLHELGHFIQSKSVFTTGASTRNFISSKIIELEYTAWIEGLRLAESLFEIDEEFRKEYLAEFSKYWLSYCIRIPELSQAELRELSKGYDHA